MAFTLPDLPYAFNALEPHVDARTMEIHHGKHHAAYVNNLNAAIQGTENEGKTLEELLANISKLPPAVRNNDSGHWNHTMFWEIMSPKGGGEPTGDVASKITKNFGAFDEFKKQFAQAAATRFGSGSAWLCVDTEDNLFITSTPNRDNPLMDVADKKDQPTLGLDVWEHAYYLHYQNRRPDYIAAWWNVVTILGGGEQAVYSRTAFSFMAAINTNPNLRKSLFYCNLWPLLSLYVIKRCLTDSREKFIICLFFNKNKKGGRDEPRICFCSKPPFSLLPDKFRQRTETKSGFSAMMAVAVARLSTFLTDRGLYFQQNMNVAIKARTEPISWKSDLYTESITWINWIVDVIFWQSDQECDVAEFTADVPQLSELQQ